MSGLHFSPLRVSAIQADADDALLVSFDVPAALRDTFAFTPGQYLTLQHIEGQDDQRRSYSICAGAGEPLRVGVRRITGGAFSTWLHAHLRVGDVVQAMPPQGKFGAAAAHPRPGKHLLGIAGGSGITPILSILKTKLQNDMSSSFTLLYGNRNAASTMFKEELEDLKNRYLTRLSLHMVFSREQVDSPLASGRIDADKISTVLRLCGQGKNGQVDDAFVCGPHALNDEAQAALLASGLAPEHIHIERFGVPPAIAQSVSHAPQVGDATGAVISILRDGLTRDIGFSAADESILAAASRAGLDVPYSCKSGVCATCRAKLTSGRVRMDRNFALEKSELDAGFILTCQAHPLTDRVAVSFDER